MRCRQPSSSGSSRLSRSERVAAWLISDAQGQNATGIRRRLRCQRRTCRSQSAGGNADQPGCRGPVAFGFTTGSFAPEQTAEGRPSVSKQWIASISLRNSASAQSKSPACQAARASLERAMAKPGRGRPGHKAVEPQTNPLRAAHIGQVVKG